MNSQPSQTRQDRVRRRWRSQRTAAMVVAVAVLAGAGAGAGAASLVAGKPSSAAIPQPLTAATPNSSSAPGPGSVDIPSLLHYVLPSVVSIQTQRGGGGGGAGTGILVSPTGEILTNAHVVDRAAKINATRYGTTKALDARLVGASPADDLALIQIAEAHDLPFANMGESGSVPVGAPVVAVGNALGLSPGTPTVTQGIISATGRTLSTTIGGRNVTLEGMLQTDAAINPGNSGGPLFDANGSVIGVNTAVANGTGQTIAQGIGFAIPIDHAKELLAALRLGGDKPTGEAPSVYLGVAAVAVTPSIRDAYGLVPEAGVLITGVAGGSPAQRAGLNVGDVIVAVDGRGLVRAEQLAAVISASQPDRHLKLQIVRGSTTTSVTVVLSTPPASTD